MSSLNIHNLLPVRPPPCPQESFESFLTRTCKENSIERLSQAQRLMFPERRSTSLYYYWGDRLKNPERFLKITTLSSSQLRSQTFEPFLAKFGWSLSSRKARQWLKTLVDKSPKWCPKCLVEDGYMRLSWRFKLIRGCRKHQINLRNRCHDCGHRPRFIPLNLNLHECSKCDAQRQDAPLYDLTDYGRRLLDEWENIILYLIAPKQWEGNAEQVLKNIGFIFSLLRQSHNKTTHEFGKDIGFSEPRILSVESGGIRLRNKPLQTLVDFSNYWDISIIQAFELGSVLTFEDYNNPFMLFRLNYQLEEARTMKLISGIGKRLPEKIKMDELLLQLRMTEKQLNRLPQSKAEALKLTIPPLTLEDMLKLTR